MKKLLAVFTAVLLVLSLTQLALGAEGEPTITFEEASDSHVRKCACTFPDGGVLHFKEEKHAVTAPDGTVDHWEPDGHWILYESENLQGDVVIPDSIDGKPVTEMHYHKPYMDWSEPCFCLEDNPELRSITFPSTLKEITMMQGCPSFVGCDKLEEILFPGEGPEKLPFDFFSGAPNLTHIKLPGAVSDLDNVFIGCPGLTSLELDPQNPHFVLDEQGILYSADKTWVITGVLGAKERKTVTLPETVIRLEDYAFAGNTQLERIEGGAPSIKGDNTCFKDCPALHLFRDMAGHWAEDAAVWGHQKNVIYGASLFTFDPDTAVDRGMAAAMIHRMEHLPHIYNEGFPDVNNHYHYYGEGVMWCKDKDIVQGCDDGLFHPERSATREQLASILYRYAQYKGKTGEKAGLSSFADAESVSPYAQEAMEWAVGSGLIQGKTGRLLDPKGTASRAEGAVLFQRLDHLLS